MTGSQTGYSWQTREYRRITTLCSLLNAKLWTALDKVNGAKMKLVFCTNMSHANLIILDYWSKDMIRTRVWQQSRNANKWFCKLAVGSWTCFLYHCDYSILYIKIMFGIENINQYQCPELQKLWQGNTQVYTTRWYKLQYPIKCLNIQTTWCAATIMEGQDLKGLINVLLTKDVHFNLLSLQMVTNDIITVEYVGYLVYIECRWFQFCEWWTLCIQLCLV